MRNLQYECNNYVSIEEEQTMCGYEFEKESVAIEEVNSTSVDVDDKLLLNPCSRNNTFVHKCSINEIG